MAAIRGDKALCTWPCGPRPRAPHSGDGAQPHTPITPPLLPPPPLSQAYSMQKNKLHCYEIIPRTEIDYYEGNGHHTSDLLDAYEYEQFGKTKQNAHIT